MPQTTKVLQCACKDGWQDQNYGPHMRLHNLAPKALTNGAWRCTVCLALKPAASDVVVAATAKTKAVK